MPRNLPLATARAKPPMNRSFFSRAILVMLPVFSSSACGSNHFSKKTEEGEALARIHDCTKVSIDRRSNL